LSAFPQLVSKAPSLAGACALALVVSGCATTVADSRGGSAGPTGPAGSAAPPLPSNVEPPPPNVNLSGFPLTYRQGYADGCASAGGTERKDTTRFAADGNYRTGWQDGLAICRRK
jgi:hypothetical protein